MSERSLVELLREREIECYHFKNRNPGHPQSYVFNVGGSTIIVNIPDTILKDGVFVLLNGNRNETAISNLEKITGKKIAKLLI